MQGTGRCIVRRVAKQGGGVAVQYQYSLRTLLVTILVVSVLTHFSHVLACKVTEARASARQMTCTNHFRNLSHACSQYATCPILHQDVLRADAPWSGSDLGPADKTPDGP